MSIGWFDDLANAKAYFTTERLVTTAWDALVVLGDPTATKAVINAYNRIFYNPKYDVPTYAAATVAQLIVLKKINGEMAYYLAQHMEDEDRRMGLRSQGVTKAGIVKEEYKDEIKLPIPPLVEDMLEEEGFVTEKAFDIIDV
ncbi:hypothetical protein KA005_23445, partial [bacterium]|nr:hypothetical protein [bacterium]